MPLPVPVRRMLAATDRFDPVSRAERVALPSNPMACATLRWPVLLIVSAPPPVRVIPSSESAPVLVKLMPPPPLLPALNPLTVLVSFSVMPVTALADKELALIVVPAFWVMAPVLDVSETVPLASSAPTARLPADCVMLRLARFDTAPPVWEKLLVTVRSVKPGAVLVIPPLVRLRLPMPALMAPSARLPPSTPRVPMLKVEPVVNVPA